MECLKELETISSIIDFGDCYKSVQQAYNLENRSLIILISDSIILLSRIRFNENLELCCLRKLFTT